ncbi:hypothetical protein MA16_Dca025472 [Dendrobium catenatum]|uniref:Uncharacterized protein n=1 Tax=Dendrobium catenatum TaxID=906689 RepID=A0A2I0WBX7_9ASPA|nr:hypothetical protein MA16_Dca025472 [Dendrobium catenatum]
MRDCYNDDLLLSQESAPAPALRSAGGTLDRRYLKQLYDNVHGTIYLDPMSLKFIDTEQFQRIALHFQLQATGSEATW